MSNLKLAMAARDAAESKKGIAPVILDVRGLSGVTDFYVLVTGNSPPHLKAMQSEVEHQLKAIGGHRYRASGEPDSGWTVLDYLGVVIHFFAHEMRERYAIEELWKDAPRIAEAKPVVSPAPVRPAVAKPAVRRRAAPRATRARKPRA